jgi:hypothetical protein
MFRGSSLTRKKNDTKTDSGQCDPESAVDTAFGDTNAVPPVGSLCSDPEGVDGDNVSSESGENDVLAVSPSGRLHHLSYRSKSKIREKIFSLYKACPDSEFTFLTLTMVTSCEDTKAARCLNKFLTVLRKQYGRFLYLWVAERQDNGNIHFHFITNRRFPIRRINALWVYQQYNSGIINEEADSAIARYSNSLNTVADLYENGEFDDLALFLNPVDIRKIKNIDSLSGYLTGYITKNKAEFSCLAWHCCRGVSALFTAMVVPEKIAVEANDPAINRSISKRTGKVYCAQQHLVANKNTGEIVAVVVSILNKEHFSRHLNEMALINKVVLGGYLVKETYRAALVASPEQYAEHFYNRVNLN